MTKILSISDANKIAVFGDIHGDLSSIEKGFSISQKEGVDYFVFLGDYADRGPFGHEVIDFVQSRQSENSRVIPMKGNHEDYELTPSGLNPKFSPCHLIKNYHSSPKKLYDWFESLPIGLFIPEKYFFVHGGISSKMDFNRLDSSTIENLLWSDPTEFDCDKVNWKRGIGRFFGPNISDEFREKYNIKTIIRSHQPDEAPLGFKVGQEGRILTISSTTIYSGKSAILIIDNSKPACDAYELSKNIRIIN